MQHRTTPMPSSSVLSAHITLGMLAAAMCIWPAPAEAGPTDSGTSVSVPYVGCPSDGQVGPFPAPTGPGQSLPLDKKIAEQLAVYSEHQGLRVLGPAGWHCAGIYGSNGAALLVTPQAITPQELLSSKSFDGPAIQLSWRSGGTSGRFEVARIIARVFPEERAFVERVIAEGLQPASDFPFGPFAKDQLTRPTNQLVEFLTPARSEGLGTQSWLRMNDRPIQGFAMLHGEYPDLIYLAVRLPPDLTDLTVAIVRQGERLPKVAGLTAD
ncbi:MAG TPA: hypothetical protein VKS60_09150 [Stellaceae bacterium]|nr:hypothetical protein [Stellaceae bacterium]